MKRICLIVVSFLFLLFVTPQVDAAVPDGLGPWADSVVTSSQGLRKNGTAVLPARSDPTAALGVAEDNTLDGSFFSLGFAGSITLGFDSGISSGTLVVEATNPGYPVETAKVEVSSDGTTWILAGAVSQDGELALPQGVTCAKYVRVTDTSNAADFVDDTADAYDVDGVKAIGDPCQVPTPTPCSQNCCNTTIIQKNITGVFTGVGVAQNTGNNTANNNNGSVNLKTGKAKTKTKVNVGGGTNTANTSSCCSSASTSATIKNNSAGSTNIIIVNN